jgi:hypothetical protein
VGRKRGGGRHTPTSYENTKDGPLRNWECDVRGTGCESAAETNVSHRRRDGEGHGRLNGLAADTQKDDTDNEGGHWMVTKEKVKKVEG